MIPNDCFRPREEVSPIQLSRSKQAPFLTWKLRTLSSPSDRLFSFSKYRQHSRMRIGLMTWTKVEFVIQSSFDNVAWVERDVSKTYNYITPIIIFTLSLVSTSISLQLKKVFKSTISMGVNKDSFRNSWPSIELESKTIGSSIFLLEEEAVDDDDDDCGGIFESVDVFQWRSSHLRNPGIGERVIKRFKFGFCFWRCWTTLLMRKLPKSTPAKPCENKKDKI